MVATKNNISPRLLSTNIFPEAVCPRLGGRRLPEPAQQRPGRVDGPQLGHVGRSQHWPGPDPEGRARDYLCVLPYKVRNKSITP